MISVKYALIMAVAAFVSGSFIASPELRAYASTIANDVICNGCVGTSDLAGNAVTAAKIKDGEVKTSDIGGSAVTNSKLANSAVNSAKIADSSILRADIADNAVGAGEIVGVSKLIFTDCSVSDGTLRNPGTVFAPNCTVLGARSGDNVIVTKNSGADCMEIVESLVGQNDLVLVYMRNDCSSATTLGAGSFSVMVFHTESIRG